MASLASVGANSVIFLYSVVNKQESSIYIKGHRVSELAVMFTFQSRSGMSVQHSLKERMVEQVH